MMMMMILSSSRLVDSKAPSDRPTAFPWVSILAKSVFATKKIFSLYADSLPMDEQKKLFAIEKIYPANADVTLIALQFFRD